MFRCHILHFMISLCPILQDFNSWYRYNQVDFLAHIGTLIPRCRFNVTEATSKVWLCSDPGLTCWTHSTYWKCQRNTTAAITKKHLRYSWQIAFLTNKRIAVSSFTVNTFIRTLPRDSQWTLVLKLKVSFTAHVIAEQFKNFESCLNKVVLRRLIQMSKNLE